MASNQKKKSASGGKRTAPAKRTQSGSSVRRAQTGSAAPRRSAPETQPAYQAPFRREVGAIVCLLLCLLTLLGYFGIEGLAPNLLSDLFKGLFGYGYWLVPPILFLGAYILGFHRGRPVRLRLTCVLLLPLMLGALLHLLLVGEARWSVRYPWGWDMLPALWTDGVGTGGLNTNCGGVLGGLLCQSFSAVFSPVGAGVVFILVLLLMLLCAFNRTIAQLVDAVRNRPRYQPEPEDEPEEEPEEEPQPKAESRPVKTPAKSGARIDIPLDETHPATGTIHVELEHPPREKKGYFDPEPAVPTPADYLTGAVSKPPRKPAEAPRPEPETEPDADADPFESPVKPAAETKSHAKADPPVSKVTREEAAQAAGQVSAEIEAGLSETAPIAYQYPPVSLLEEGELASGEQALGELKRNQDRLAETIRSFGVEATIVNVVRGPSVTRYEMELDQGVKLSRVTNLADDIALALGAEAVRIAPIPDKISTVGIEVPNKLVSTVHIHDVIDSPTFRNASSKVSFSVGKDIGGNAIVGNISKLPHLLIAGTTGSGKSVCTNSLIISLLYKATPDEVRLIMVDPKMVELGIYNGIPHLLIPVVTDPKKAAGALQWAVTEMMKRYRTFSEVGVRDLASYNAKAAKTEGMTKYPQVVVLIDELADLMLVAAKEVEESICRVAQMGRAAGMHLVIATQRPSADVITGLMKANIPSRIAFAVSSSLESRIILDATGAEKLVGKGDMLWFPLGASKPHRVQGCFVSDEEVAAVVNFVKQSGSAEYDESVMEEIDRNAQEKEKGAKGAGGPAPDEVSDDFDELLPAAIEVVVEMGQASVSMLQRRLKLGYGRAARLVDQMEEKGVVGPYEGSKPRSVLINKEQWAEMQYRQGLSPAPDALPLQDSPDEEDDPPFDPEDDRSED